ncbi:MAG TPA: ABC transporter substrate-binding protein [Sporichthyaceae bacterium]|jgi:polar amino acid transport system substrate-binding protein
MRRIRPVVAPTLALLLLSVAGCGGSSKSPFPGYAAPGNTSASTAPSSSPSSSTGPLALPSPNPGLVAEVPASVAKAGTLHVGTDTSYAPSEFLGEDGKTAEGFDIDLFRAVAAELGLKTDFISAPFDNIIPGVLSGKYDVGVSSFTINADRMKKATMVSYFSAGMQWATRSGNPAGVSLDDACGKHIAVQTATTEVDDLTARSKKCTDAGKSAISIDQFQNQDEATAAAVSGKDDAMSADSPVIAYAIKQSGGRLAALGDAFGTAPYGYVLKLSATDLGKAISDAVNELMANGQYRQILEHWGVGAGAISGSKVNPTP